MRNGPFIWSAIGPFRTTLDWPFSPGPNNVTFSDEDQDGVTVAVYNNEMAIEEFVKRYLPDAAVLEPKGLQKKLLETMKAFIASENNTDKNDIRKR